MALNRARSAVTSETQNMKIFSIHCSKVESVSPKTTLSLALYANRKLFVGRREYVLNLKKMHSVTAIDMRNVKFAFGAVVDSS